MKRFIQTLFGVVGAFALFAAASILIPEPPVHNEVNEVEGMLGKAFDSIVSDVHFEKYPEEISIVSLTMYHGRFGRVEWADSESVHARDFQITDNGEIKFRNAPDDPSVRWELENQILDNRNRH